MSGTETSRGNSKADGGASTGTGTFTNGNGAAPTNVYSFVYRSLDRFGVATVLAIGAALFAFHLHKTGREDRALDRGVLESMVGEQRKATSVLERMVDKLDDVDEKLTDHLEDDDRNHR